MSLHQHTLNRSEGSAAAVIRELRSANEDWEWYPTTKKMLDVIREDIRAEFGKSYGSPDDYPAPTVLDCGAGDGRALVALAGRGKKLSIEKAMTLVRLQPNDVIPVGTDFAMTTLVDKPCSIVFSNPPYAEYEQWGEKIIREANAPVVYLIVPVRWSASAAIQRALKLREATTSTLLTTDFLDAERAARARVDIVKVTLGATGYCHRDRDTQCAVDPFGIWFAGAFPRRAEVADGDERGGAAESAALRESVRQEVVQGRSLIEALCRLHDAELDGLQKNYTAASQLDPDLMREIGVTHEKLLASIKERVKGLKHRYWQELFTTYESITGSLSTKSRETLLDTLNANTSVEFNEANAIAITLWVLKNADEFYESQLIALCERMASAANVEMYVSNQRTYGREQWRYLRWREDGRAVPERYALDYRIVLESMGGICTSQWSYEQTKNAGLDGHAAAFLQDILAVASTLGWSVTSGRHGITSGRQWESNKLETFYCPKGRLMDVRAFKNGNLHVRFHPDFIRKLNVEFGRLKGWLRSKQEVVDELRISAEEAEAYFGSTAKVLSERAPALLLGLDASEAA